MGNTSKIENEKIIKKGFKENSAITLIALVITIIVLLILAGVTVATLTGDNGLLTKAGQAKQANEESALKEEVSLMLLQSKTGDNLESLFGSENVNKDGSIYEVTYKGKEFLLNSDYEFIDKIEPAYEGEWTFNPTTQALTAYNGNLDTKRGNQEPGEIIIPNYYNGKRVKIIDQNIFYQNEKITKLTISYGIEKINSCAFYYCTNLTGNLIIPDSVTIIEQRVFQGCSSLNGTLKLSNSLEAISTDVFKGCNFKGDLTIPNSVRTIAWGAFNGLSSLDGKLTLGNNIESIGYAAFSGCSGLKGDLILPDSLTQLDSYAFSACSSLDGKIRISKNLETIPNYAFYNCSKLKGDLTIPDSVTSIGQVAFENCTSLNGNLKLSSNLTTINVEAFYNCSGLKGDIVMGINVATVGYVSFYGCNQITSVKFLNPETNFSTPFFATSIKIIGYENSTAQTYASSKGNEFIPITQ